jgi:hypothetical protein
MIAKMTFPEILLGTTNEKLIDMIVDDTVYVVSKGFLAPRTVNGTKISFIMILQCYLYRVAQPCGQYVSTLTGRPHHSLPKESLGEKQREC